MTAQRQCFELHWLNRRKYISYDTFSTSRQEATLLPRLQKLQRNDRLKISQQMTEPDVSEVNVCPSVTTYHNLDAVMNVKTGCLPTFWNKYNSKYSDMKIYSIDVLNMNIKVL